MSIFKEKKIKQFNKELHRDLGYFFSSLIIVYAVSGIALNHVDDWNPDFIIKRDTIEISQKYSKNDVDEKLVKEFGELVGEEDYKIFDFPTPDQVKIYYQNASFHLNFTTHKGVYERIYRRPLFYEVNVLHRNSLKGWRWMSDIFAVMLIVINLTGLFMLSGKQGIAGRGKWLIAAGLLPPIGAIFIYQLFS